MAPTKDFDASSPDLLAPTQDVAVGTPVRDDGRHLGKDIHPLTARAKSVHPKISATMAPIFLFDQCDCDGDGDDDSDSDGDGDDDDDEDGAVPRLQSVWIMLDEDNGSRDNNGRCGARQGGPKTRKT